MSRKLLEGASGVAEKAEGVVETASTFSEVAKKIGWKAVISAVFTLLITVVPIFFAIDSRYAKYEEVHQQLEELDHQEDVLAEELNKLAGAQQTMITFMAARAHDDQLSGVSQQISSAQDNLAKLKEHHKHVGQ